MERIEGRNPVFECLLRNKRAVRRILIDQGAKPDERITKILEIARQRGIRVEHVERRALDKLAEDRVHNGIIAEADPLPSYTAAALIDVIWGTPDPFFVMVDEVSYEHNLGAILRTSLGFGVSGVVVPTRRGTGLSPVVHRVAMGAAEEVPLVREGLYAALKPIKKAGFRIIGADMGGTPAHQADLRGAVALLLGGEGEGLSAELRQRCDQVVSVPLRGGLESLNVSVAAALLMYEKRRQDGWFTGGTEPRR